MKEAKKLVEERPIEITCTVCGEKLEAKTYMEIFFVEMNHLQQSHKETFDELEAIIAKSFDLKSQPAE